MQQQARELIDDMEYFFGPDEQYVLASLYDAGDYAAVIDMFRQEGFID